MVSPTPPAFSSVVHNVDFDLGRVDDARRLVGVEVCCSTALPSLESAWLGYGCAKAIDNAAFTVLLRG